MNGFVIFLIVLTIGYVLYYAAIITIDLTAKPKDDGKKEETLAMGDMADDMGYTPKTVKESSDGGFSVSDDMPETAEADEQTPEPAPAPLIAEAEEETPETLEPEPGTSQEPDHSHEENPSEEETGGGMTEEQTQEEPEQQTEELAEEQEEEIEGITSVTFDEDADVTVREEVDKSDLPAFDPNMNPPSYDVSEVYGAPQRDTSVSRKADLVRSSLSSIETKGNQFSSFDLRNILQDESQTKQENIVVHNEASRA